MTSKEPLLARLRAAGQEHLLRHWDELAEPARAALAAEIEALDLDLLGRLYAERDRLDDVRAVAQQAEEPPAFRLHDPENRIAPETARAAGRQALAAGQVGTMLVAGGQGTRLGFNHPKGMFSAGPLSHKSLFALHIEKLLAARRRSGAAIPLYLMTSPATHAETVRYLEENGRFGLPAEDLFVFCQGTMPALDLATGRVLLDAPDRLVASPDGHGGMLAAFQQSGGLDDARRRGVEHLYYFQIDNPLADICDEEFLGYHLLTGSEMTSQVIRKQDPLARVGNVVRLGDRLRVIEYSDLPDDVAARRRADGSLAIWAGSIAVHVFAVSFLRRMAAQADGLPFHYAQKKVPHIDAQGRRVEPREPNALKLERFIFDLLPHAERAIVVEIDPAEGFAPIKNAPGAATDTPELCREQMMALHRRWLRAAGVEIADDVPVEISPLFATSADELRGKFPPGTRLVEPTHLEGDPTALP